MSEADSAPMGHNRTLAERFAELNAEIPDYLAGQYPHLTDQAAMLREEFDIKVPASVDDDATERDMTDLGARINAFLGLVEGQRKVNKDVPLKSPQLIDTFFKGLRGGLEANLETLRLRVNHYKNKKAEAERRRVAEERARALAVQQEADRAAREAERLRREAEEARIRECEDAAAEGRRAQQTEAEVIAASAEAEADQRAAEVAEVIAAAAPPPSAPMVKAESGAKSGQLGKWVAKNVDRDILDLDALRHMIPTADLEKYANAYARQYKDTKPLRGAVITQEFTTTFRS